MKVINREIIDMGTLKLSFTWGFHCKGKLIHIILIDIILDVFSFGSSLFINILISLQWSYIYVLRVC